MTKKILVLAMLFVAASILNAGIAGAAAQTDSIWSQQPAAQDSQAGKAALKAKQTAEKAPPYYENVEDVKEIPKTLSPGAFDDPTTKQAYQVAQDNPKLLLQLPCYCPAIAHATEQTSAIRVCSIVLSTRTRPGVGYASRKRLGPRGCGRKV